MANRPAPALVLREGARGELERWTRASTIGAGAARRARIVLLAADGVAIWMISSDLEEILGMSDRVLVMREGRIVAEFTRAEATQERIAAAMMSDIGDVNAPAAQGAAS